jgi:ABC-type dipeptide/oligopeptide/nickel transport system permease component
MVRYIIRRLIYSIPVLVIASILVFIVMRKAADPTAAQVGAHADVEHVCLSGPEGHDGVATHLPRRLDHAT